jgi:hypothetical protein
MESLEKGNADITKMPEGDQFVRPRRGEADKKSKKALRPLSGGGL